MTSFRVPATLSNLGPGYDVLGLALNLGNVFHVDFELPVGVYRADGEPDPSGRHLVISRIRRFYSIFGMILVLCMLACVQLLEAISNHPTSFSFPKGRSLSVGGSLPERCMFPAR